MSNLHGSRSQEPLSPRLRVPLFKPWISRADKRAVQNVLLSQWLTGGPERQRFERDFARYLGVRYAVSVSSCTAALHLTIKALDIGEGDEVLVPTFTFAATANAVMMCGARPKLVDMNPLTFNISPSDIDRKLSRNTRAIIVVHYGGQSCEMEEILEIAKERNLRVVEDCAHSLGARRRGKMVGTFGLASCFSFYATKNITSGEGGMVATNSHRLANKIHLMREHCMTRSAYERAKRSSWKYDIKGLGYNYRMTDIQCALARSQLSRIDSITKRRIQAAECYTRQLSEKARTVTVPYEAPGNEHVYHLYTVLLGSRDSVFERLSRKGIGLSVHYRPLHQMTFYKRALKCRSSDFPEAERISKRNLTLPLFPQITRRDQDFVVSELAQAVR